MGRKHRRIKLGIKYHSQSHITFLVIDLHVLQWFRSEAEVEETQLILEYLQYQESKL